MEKNMKYVCVYLRHFAVLWKLTQHCKSTILQKKICKQLLKVNTDSLVLIKMNALFVVQNVVLVGVKGGTY